MEKPILEVLEGVPDYRKGNAIRHNLSDILMTGLPTMICNGGSCAGMHIFAQKCESPRLYAGTTKKPMAGSKKRMESGRISQRRNRHRGFSRLFSFYQ